MVPDPGVDALHEGALIRAQVDAVPAVGARGDDVEPAVAVEICECEARAARLLPGLLLARVDGKSPVEYLTDEGDKETVRRVATQLLDRPAARLIDIASLWSSEIQS